MASLTPCAVVELEAVRAAGTMVMPRARDAFANGGQEGCTRRVVACHIWLITAAVLALATLPQAGSMKRPVWATSLERRRHPPGVAVELVPPGDGIKHYALASAKGVPEIVVAVVASLGVHAHAKRARAAASARVYNHQGVSGARL